MGTGNDGRDWKRAENPNDGSALSGVYHRLASYSDDRANECDPMAIKYVPRLCAVTTVKAKDCPT